MNNLKGTIMNKKPRKHNSQGGRPGGRKGSKLMNKDLIQAQLRGETIKLTKDS